MVYPLYNLAAVFNRGKTALVVVAVQGPPLSAKLQPNGWVSEHVRLEKRDTKTMQLPERSLFALHQMNYSRRLLLLYKLDMTTTSFSRDSARVTTRALRHERGETPNCPHSR